MHSLGTCSAKGYNSLLYVNNLLETLIDIMKEINVLLYINNFYQAFYKPFGFISTCIGDHGTSSKWMTLKKMIKMSH